MHVDLAWRLCIAGYPVLVKVRLLRATFLEGDLPKQCQRDTPHDATLHLRPHPLGVHLWAAINSDIDARDDELAVGATCAPTTTAA